MGDNSAIEWTDASWPVVTGCEYASEGCRFCYAARETAGRLSGHPAYAGLATRRPGEPASFTGEVRCHEDRLDQPLRWRRPRRIFVTSMGDLFHPGVPSEFLERAFHVMAYAEQHQFQVLTKRPKRMQLLLRNWSAAGRLFGNEAPGVGGVRPPLPYYGRTLPLANVWAGTSIELDEFAFRADHVRLTPAAVRFLSLEPLLGPLPSLDLSGIDWVIVGGESGPNARPMHPDWARDLRDRCVAAGVPFFFKQWGEYESLDDGRSGEPTHLIGHDRDDYAVYPADAQPDWGVWTPLRRVGKKAAGRELDGRTWDEMPVVEAPA